MKRTVNCQKYGTVIQCPIVGNILDCGHCTLCESTLGDIMPFGENDQWGSEDSQCVYGTSTL